MNRKTLNAKEIEEIYDKVYLRGDVNPSGIIAEFLEVEKKIKFWRNPYKCRECKMYHPGDMRCTYEDRRFCNRCGSKEHTQSVCNNITYISNRVYYCGCDIKTIKILRGERNTKIGTHCCICLEPNKITEMQISELGYKARCDNCRIKAEKDYEKDITPYKRHITPPESPIPPKKGKEKEEDVVIYDSPEKIEDDPMEGVLPIITGNQPEGSSSPKKIKCSCWNKYSKYCDKHQHQPMIENGKCMMCPKVENVIKVKEAREVSKICRECNITIHQMAMKSKCQAGDYYCYNCYLKIPHRLEKEEDMKRCPIHYQCVVFESKAAKKRWNDLDEEIQIRGLDNLFELELKECQCPYCYKIGTLWRDGNEIFCKRCDKRQRMKRDEKNNKFFLKLAQVIIEAKAEAKTANQEEVIVDLSSLIKKNDETIKEEELIEYERMQEAMEQKEREIEYIRDYYKKQLEEQDNAHREALNKKEERIQELNNTIAQQNVKIEKVEEENYLKTFVEQQYVNSIDQLNKTVSELYMALNATHTGIDLLIHEDRIVEGSTSPEIGPIHMQEFLFGNAEVLREFKEKVNLYDKLDFYQIMDNEEKAQNYDELVRMWENEKLRLTQLSNTIHSCAEEARDWEYSEELEAFAESMINWSGNKEAEEIIKMDIEI